MRPREERGRHSTTPIIATTRPETLLGDTAVAIHPEDERYKHLHGKKAMLPLSGRTIPVITDEYVDKRVRHRRPQSHAGARFQRLRARQAPRPSDRQVMGKDGQDHGRRRPLRRAQVHAAERREQGRRKTSRTQGLLVKVEDHAHKVGLCQRCENVAEPIISMQWFVKIEPLAKPAIEAVETGKINFTPKSWEKTYFEWMYNIRDWCISRQLWWGHQIPAWYCGDCQESPSRARRPTPVRALRRGAELKQDEDVLDTWFSSGALAVLDSGLAREDRGAQDLLSDFDHGDRL